MELDPRQGDLKDDVGQRSRFRQLREELACQVDGSILRPPGLKGHCLVCSD